MDSRINRTRIAFDLRKLVFRHCPGEITGRIYVIVQLVPDRMLAVQCHLCLTPVCPYSPWAAILAATSCIGRWLAATKPPAGLSRS